MIKDFSPLFGVLKKSIHAIRMHRVTLETFPVRVIVTGVEHSGTTLLSRLLTQDPNLSCAFECGFLLADNPRDFKNIHPWYEWMQEPVAVKQWGVSKDQMDRICASRSWEEAYGKLICFSPVFDQDTPQQVCDKTPRYLKKLDTVLAKIPSCIPCFVIEKDLDTLWRSHKKRYGDLDAFVQNMKEYNLGLKKGLQNHSKRIYRVPYSNLCTNLTEELKKIYEIVGLTFKDDYVTGFRSELEKYYHKSQLNLEPLTKHEEGVLDVLRRGLP